MNRPGKIITILTLGFLLLLRSEAAPLFEITLDNDGSLFTAGGNNLEKLLKDAIIGRGLFASFSNTFMYGVSVRYAGVSNALSFTVTGRTNASNFSAGSDINGTDGTNLAKRVTDEIKENFDSRLPRVRAGSLVSVTDGNPNSTTAIMADDTYEQFASLPMLTRDERESAAAAGESAEAPMLEISPDVGRISAGGFSGSTFTLPMAYRRRLSDLASLAISTPVNFTEIEDARVYRAGVGFGLPLRLVRAGPRQHLAWQATFSGSMMGGVSDEFAEGALVGQGAFSSSLSYDLPFCTLAMGNHFSFYESTDFAGYGSSISQQISKNGLKIGIPIGRGWVWETWGIHNYFVQEAALKNYATVGGSIAYRRPAQAGKPSTGGKATAYFSVYAHLGADYVSPHFRFGSRWKF